jgi:hypothetical protein
VCARVYTEFHSSGAKGLDIEKLKNEVEERGGFARVEERREWRQIARAMGVPPNTCAEHLRRQFVAVVE